MAITVVMYMHWRLLVEFPYFIPTLNAFTALDPLLARLDGLLLPGGVDMQPSRYGEEKHPLTEEADPQLDQFELSLTSWALKEDVPILGICRGMQVINVALGGSLYQDLSDQYPGSIRHSQRDLPRTHLSHHIIVEPGSQVESLLGTQELWVNSLLIIKPLKPLVTVCISADEPGMASRNCSKFPVIALL